MGFCSDRRLLRQVLCKLDEVLDNQGALMTDVARLLTNTDDIAAAISQTAAEAQESIGEIRVVVDELRAIAAGDPAVQDAVNRAADKLEAGVGTLQETTDAIRAAGDDPGSPVPPVPEPEPPVE